MYSCFDHPSGNESFMEPAGRFMEAGGCDGVRMATTGPLVLIRNLGDTMPQDAADACGGVSAGVNRESTSFRRSFNEPCNESPAMLCVA